MNNIFDLINDSDSIVILTHENPDGDAVGSSLAIYNMLKVMNKTVDIVMTKIPSVFSYLNGINEVIFDTDKEYDLAIVLDCASKERICQNSNIFSRCKKSIGIDHHISNTLYCDINLVDGECPACCQVLYKLFKDNEIDITLDIAICLISGVLTDTNGFKNNNVNKETFLLASDLIDIGIDFHELYNILLCKKTMPQHLLMKMAMDRIELFSDGKIAFSYISQEDMANVVASYGDHEGLVELGRDILGVEVSIFVREDDGYRVSFRSNGKIDVNKIAAVFAGGGHKMAAGCKLSLSFKETKEVLISETKKVIDEYEWNNYN